MGFLVTPISVLPGKQGLLYRDNQFVRMLPPGNYRLWDTGQRYKAYLLPTSDQYRLVVNQEVLSKDNIAFRFSFSYNYRIIDFRSVLERADLSRPGTDYAVYTEPLLSAAVQAAIRRRLGEHNSEELNEKRGELFSGWIPEVNEAVANLGVSITAVELINLTFPKSIQDLFARQLEAILRSKADLENARSAVAAARALKNASELMKGDDNIRFIQYLEVLTKIAEKGRHTFVIGEPKGMPELGKAVS